MSGIPLEKEISNFCAKQELLNNLDNLYMEYQEYDADKTAAFELVYEDILNLIDAQTVNIEGQCPFCGSKLVEYPHTMNKPLALALCILYQKGKPTVLSDLKLDMNTHNNFQKMKHFGVIRHTPESNLWSMTLKGKAFVEGKCSIPRRVFTFKNKVSWYDKNDRVYLSDIVESGFMKKADYLNELRRVVTDNENKRKKNDID